MTRFVFIFLIGLSFISSSLAQDVPAASPQETSPQELVPRIVKEMDRDLAGWYPRCVDSQRGGFHTVINRDWSVGSYSTKGIVSQARITWTAAEVAHKRPEWHQRLEPVVRHGAKFLREKMWDARCGGFYWEINADGTPPVDNDTMKHAYGQSFGIYAMATVYRLTKDENDLQLAKDAFHWLDRYGHDSRYGGYFEAFYRDGGQMRQPTKSEPNVKVGKVGELLGTKSMNTHIHLLESFTALYQVWPDPLLRSRLEELLHIVRDKITTWPGAMRQFFNDDWSAAATFVSFGHDIETAFLMTEAIEALGRPDDPQTLKVCQNLVDHSLEFGWDTENGGFFYEGATFGHPVNRSKAWWTQAEGLNTLCLAHLRFEREGRGYSKFFVQQWEFIERRLIDPEYGGWYNETNEDGTLVQGTEKGHLWKTPYHEVRAMLNVVEMLEKSKL
ncbi:MAG: AGE family epimerase/isomerase [Planctomycetaceae bacterium]|nr:AGE family epimerase/isomerase [Planctomycetaceae bacterium]